ncbi:MULTISPECIES: subclass B3 metallo-beta-lactamase [unclassified Sphingomonas]|uniref:subclass B3 metallo-beta-lactamase n=1 Tax=unclassified Sphingomonas TaxID=196159 RepID=UPI0006F6841B|nr:MULTISPECIES: subclass B3 metallo-beta-lactamase [unclassified Sphingomonas]KQM66566.1 subclass B3 metallo-beta-lactamase [Sphingomonas sp. Leaf16]KQN16715.1 subclass B3 metallo-beta-lactamase [Sphingomonas sp. Leaf29]KQN23376.1 subclass B3 metallo-beta-lactamase [Sphingomonas sp. Leaf32]
MAYREFVRGWLTLAAMLATAPAFAADPPEWSMPAEPFRIADNLYYVGTQGLSAYLIVSRDGAILLDGTLDRNAALIERNIRRVGVPLNRVRLIVSNHAHDDHVGAIARIKRDTGARFLASVADRWALEHGTSQSDVTYRPRSYPPVKVDRIVGDGEVVRLGEVALTAHLTPGHTPGCTSWSMVARDAGKLRRVLFPCSITVAGNRLIGNRGYPGIVADFRRTFARLAAMRADIVLPGHPEAADVIERGRRRRAGQADAFVDPALLPRMVTEQRAAFEAELAQAKPR